VPTLAALGGLVALATTLAGALVLAVPAGQPYDEPAHWANVLFYLDQHRMPVVGEPAAQYEAQMGPLYYVLSAVVLAATGQGDSESGFYLLRWLWIALVPWLGLGTYRLAHLLTGRRDAALAAAALIVVNPLILAMSASLQNDVLCLALALVSSLAAVGALRASGPGLGAHVLAGALIGLAVLAKLFAIGLLLGLVLGYAVDPRLAWRARARRAGAAVVGCTLVCGWWIVRNVLLYGNLTGRTGTSAGYSFPPLRLSGPGDLVRWLGSIVSYVFVPTEYYRNALDAPTVAELGAGILALAAVVLCSVAAWRVFMRGGWRAVAVGRPDRAFALATLVVVLVGYAWSAWAIQAIAPRLAFVAAPLAAALVAGLLRSRAGRVLMGATVLMFLAVDVWIIVGTSALAPAPYWIHW
jgi:4-amino-4-deoxy-L-arabinose transferase-like glycosyltransferase